MAFKSVSGILMVILLIAIANARDKPKRSDFRKSGGNRSFKGGCKNKDITNNISALWQQVNTMVHPIEVHVHDHDHASHHSHHSHHHHHSHKNGTKGVKSKHHDHGSHPGHHHDQHIHIHLSLEENKCPYMKHKPTNEFRYARCDMQGHKKVKGTIYMRQMPFQELQTKVDLEGFNKASPGIKDGVHDYFFDLHDSADFTKGCASFGGHEHVHDHGKQEDKDKPQADQHHSHHRHNTHKHHHDHDSHHHDHDSHHHNHNHGSHHHNHDSNLHSSDEHHHHLEGDGFGNVIVDKKGISKMEVNITSHELYGPFSMMGRGLVLHDKDDKNVCCCAITYANMNDADWDKL